MSKRKKFWTLRAAANEPGVGELLLYGEIADYTWWGDEVTPKQFKEELDALGGISELRVYINSPGGDVFAGQAIHSMLKRHKARVTVYIDGLAASIASVIAMAGDEVVIPVNAMMMIHQPWTIAAGNAADFRKLADDLDKIAESVVAAYAEKTGLDNEEIIALMDAETWLTAKEAVDLGFADTLEESRQVAASLRDGTLVVQGHEFDLSRYRTPPKLAFLTPSDDDIAAAIETAEQIIDKCSAEPEPDDSTNEPEREAEVLALERELLKAALF